MAKKQKRERFQNPQPFLPSNDDDKSVASSKKRSKAAKHHQKQDKVIFFLFFCFLLGSYLFVCLITCVKFYR